MKIEEAIRLMLLDLDAVTALTATIRPHELIQSDRLPAIIVTVESRKPQNDLSGKGGLVNAMVYVSAMSSRESLAVDISEAVRVNGTDPGTGLAGFTGTAGTLPIKSAMLIDRPIKYYAYEDGKDGGFFSCDSIYDVWYNETI